MFGYFTRLIKKKKPLVVICGPTASGKTTLSLDVAELVMKQGVTSEIISADSRQIYRSIPIFSGAIQHDEMRGIAHHLVASEDIGELKSVEWFTQTAHKTIEAISSRGHVPVVVGGSAFWIQSLLFDTSYPMVEPNPALRKELENKSTDELHQQLTGLDPRRAGEIDAHNPRRLIRAIEIATELGAVPRHTHKIQSKYSIILVYIAMDKKTNDARIVKNVQARIEQGLVEEARRVHKTVSTHRMHELGLAYKHIDALERGEISLEEYSKQVIQEEQQYAKRQRTFFNKMIDRYSGTTITIHNRDNQETKKIVQAISGVI